MKKLLTLTLLLVSASVVAGPGCCGRPAKPVAKTTKKAVAPVRTAECTEETGKCATPCKACPCENSTPKAAACTSCPCTK